MGQLGSGGSCLSLPPGTSDSSRAQESKQTGRTPRGLGSEWAHCDFSLILLANTDLVTHPEAAGAGTAVMGQKTW